jgi:hypothetical protein
MQDCIRERSSTCDRDKVDQKADKTLAPHRLQGQTQNNRFPEPDREDGKLDRRRYADQIPSPGIIG